MRRCENKRTVTDLLGPFRGFFTITGCAIGSKSASGGSSVASWATCGGGGGTAIGRAGGAAAVKDLVVVVCRKRFDVEEVANTVLSDVETMEVGAI